MTCIACCIGKNKIKIRSARTTATCALGECNFEAIVQLCVCLHPQHLTIRIIRKRHRLVPRARYGRGGLLDTQEPHARELDVDVKRARHGQLALHIRHLRARRPILRDAHAIIDIQCTCSRTVRAGCDDELECLRAQFRRRHRTRRAERENGATADVQRDLGEVDVRERDILACAVDRHKRREVVKAVLWEVDRD